MKSSEEVKQFYDNYQHKFRHNVRHYIILNKLLDLGLKHSKHILEIGCGNGALTKLMVDKLNNGKITAVDISSESIAHAKVNLKGYTNITHVVSDIADFTPDSKFDMVVISDVLEHIPMDYHDGLFKKLNEVMGEDGLIFINIPEPKALEWVAKHEPEKLQVIDQALHSDKLLSAAYKHGFYLTELKSYPIYKDNADSQNIVFAKRSRTYDYKPVSQLSIIITKYYCYFRSKLK